jgi:peptide/nickel transport system permease protein
MKGASMSGDAPMGRRWAVQRRTAGLGLLGLMLLFAVLVPGCSSVDPAVQDLRNSLAAPSWTHPLGTDLLGRDVLTRLGHAARLSLFTGLLATFTAAVPGALLGLLAAWRGGRLDRLLVMAGDATLALPGLLLVLLVAALAPGQLWALYLGLSVSMWVEYFRVCRATARPVLAGPAVEAARLLGLPPRSILRRHLWPAVGPTLGSLLPLTAAQAVLSLSALGFIGVGLQPPQAELGLMLTEYLPHYDEAPWLIASPVGLLMALVLALLLATDRRSQVGTGGASLYCAQETA